MTRIASSRAVRVLTVAAAAAAGLAMAGPAHAAVEYGSHFHGHQFAGGNWGGYVSFGSFTTATASWTEPTVTCRSGNDLFAPWVGIDGDGSSTVEQTGVETDCSSGRPVYSAWYEMYPAAPVYYSVSVGAGDKITATVTRTATNTYKLDLTDSTKGWTKTTTKSLTSKHASAEAIIESPTDSYPTISGGIKFTGVKFNGTNLASTSPSGLSADDRGTNTWTPGAIGSDGQSFTISRH
ncbi:MULTISPECIES: G1 family glutamic endopeptidase [unclassified Amycolatopsis]|uniref:G1 family glutamic endopeptidase n=1 Tax=unclassified Amycolatopsis TaxID=2618356 RepID=UPI001FF189F5|nr:MULTISPECIES: G1 family glutamic endopeptidase [unclassified Amycolatopsis]UOZ09266.1 G1 family endopeptidase [Amycolatopsis sp. WQ 127309]WSJ75521.1 G1 family endopeptidase [Amycolatopsis sp. NBC_01307]WSK80821.1 G1 family endopeptidase [Amycolatopsis sp. NBC_01286]